MAILLLILADHVTQVSANDRGPNLCIVLARHISPEDNFMNNFSIAIQIR